MPIRLCCSQVPAVALLASAPFGLSGTAFWMYVYGAVLLILSLIRVRQELPQENGVDKIMPFGCLFFAIPMGVFATEHFTDTKDIAALVPRWIPAHTFWAYAVGLGFLCAGLSMAVRVQARLAAALVAMTFLIFVCVMDLPGAIAHPHSRFAWAFLLRELSFGSGAFAFALSSWSTRPRPPSSGRPNAARAAALPRLFIGIASLFYGVEHFLHPEHVPGIPLEMLTPAWIPGRIFLSYFVGVVLIFSGVCLLANQKARPAATFLGATILLAVLWIYLPILVAAPKSVEALNYFFDTL
ncbi:MAG TPA: hypothetical protein VJQ54_12300, partial [Candidatus Sulfotelmatobacter sp.]|nr:hypothetical protein [Candidatus Sulfotelmatobacter sp.]